ncbi:MAG: hypothetical protein KGJ55_10765 [Gammaproteobacteria bacterium]|nr:hypothetical protein [Gammaproteobacteria bacterium]
MSTTLENLPKLPSPYPAYRRALWSMLTQSGDPRQLPELGVRVAGVTVDPRRLAAYREVCGLPPSDQLPITYPQVLAGSLHLHLLSRPQFTLPLLGLIHVANRIHRRRPLAAGQPLDLKVRIGESRRAKRGLEFDLLTEAAIGAVTVWSASATVLQLRNRSGDGKQRPKTAGASSYQRFDAPADIGRRYARVSGDYNPIHLSAASARMFGFPRAIAHGMWTLARCLSLLPGVDADSLDELTVQFKQPLLLPAQAALRWRGDGLPRTFELVGDSGRVHLSGGLR